jgi:hypothetical protein
VRPSAENSIWSTERSQSGASARRSPVFRSINMMWKRSASKPGRCIARHASVLPSGENTGCASHAGLSAVRLRGSPPPLLTSYRSKFVDHGSDLPFTRASNTTLLPSGENVYSLASPNGFDGTSASNVFVSESGATARPFSIVSTNSWEMRPSLHVSQCRTNVRS